MKPLNLDLLREAVAQGRIQWRKHVLQKLAERGMQQQAVREVDATVCSQCGEEWIDDATARQLEQIVNDARARRLQVEVAALK